MQIGIAADHGGYELKEKLKQALVTAGHEVEDHGAMAPDPGDDYPDFVIPLARAVADGDVQRGIAICGSGVGACVAANKVAGVRSALINDVFSARQVVEDYDAKMIYMGWGGSGRALAWDLGQVVLAARFSVGQPCRGRLDSVGRLEGSDDE